MENKQYNNEKKIISVRFYWGRFYLFSCPIVLKKRKRICIGYRYADAFNNLYIKYADNKGEHSQYKELKRKGKGLGF